MFTFQLLAEVSQLEATGDGPSEFDETVVLAVPEGPSEPEPDVSVEKRTTAIDVRPSFTKKKKLSDRDSSTANIDKSLEAMQKYFTARANAQSTAQPAPSSEPDDDETLFGKMITSELRKITSTAIKRELKKEIINAIYDAQAREADQQLTTAARPAAKSATAAN